MALSDFKLAINLAILQNINHCLEYLYLIKLMIKFNEYSFLI